MPTERYRMQWGLETSRVALQGTEKRINEVSTLRLCSHVIPINKDEQDASTTPKIYPLPMTNWRIRNQSTFFDTIGKCNKNSIPSVCRMLMEIRWVGVNKSVDLDNFERSVESAWWFVGSITKSAPAGGKCMAGGITCQRYGSDWRADGRSLLEFPGNEICHQNVTNSASTVPWDPKSSHQEWEEPDFSLWHQSNHNSNEDVK